MKIEMEIDKDGTVKLTVTGVSGAGCLAVTKDLEEMLGLPLSASKKTADFYKLATRTQSVLLQQKE